jgi:hypothetical protein
MKPSLLNIVARNLAFAAAVLISAALISCQNNSSTRPSSARTYSAMERDEMRKDYNDSVDDLRLWQENSSCPSFPQLSR